MNKTLFRSIWAVVAGAIVGIILSLVTDAALERTGILPQGNLYVASWLISMVIFYRTVYGSLAAYVTAKLAPQKPLKHALIGGAVALFVNIAGTIATWNMNLGPHWYSVTLAILAVPTAWLGGSLYKPKNN